MNYIFLNFPININKSNIVIHECFDNGVSIYQDIWLNCFLIE